MTPVQWHEWSVPVPDDWDRYLVHQRVAQMLYGGAPHADRGHLWVLDGAGVSVRSARPPLMCPSERASAEVFEGAFHPFRLQCNPTIAEAQGYGAPSKRRSLTSPGDVLAWLERQGERHGFAPTVATAENRGPVRWRRRGRLCTVGCIDIAGELEVVDAAAFASALIGGVGRARALGFGMIRLGGGA